MAEATNETNHGTTVGGRFTMNVVVVVVVVVACVGFAAGSKYWRQYICTYICTNMHLYICSLKQQAATAYNT